jgi:hypothetical protein
MLDVKVNGNWAGNIYVNREGWDCYTTEIPLAKGLNRIEVSYTNNLTRIVDSTEDRNFYLKSLYILQPEESQP